MPIEHINYGYGVMLRHGDKDTFLGTHTFPIPISIGLTINVAGLVCIVIDIDDEDGFITAIPK